VYDKETDKKNIASRKGMNLILDTLEKKPKEAQRLLGISYEQFLQLVDLAQKLHEHQIELKETQKVRINRAL
jgi:hypothetical protein